MPGRPVGGGPLQRGGSQKDAPQLRTAARRHEPEGAPLLQASRMLPPATVIRSAGRGRVAGPASTAPSVMANLLPWHAQSIVASPTSETVHPACVQIAEKALNSPASGWVTTTFRSLKTFPPPTGMSEVFASSPACGARVPDAGGLGGGVLAPPSPDDPQPVASAAAPALRTVLRRVLMVLLVRGLLMVAARTRIVKQPGGVFPG
ncbi:hypothetical protein Sfulv_10870 [Streptomyces fulvorobeus]|uniref:Uncharacterized protein n=1 Tax=Streptomyces fulvorobeus TaxID=284028 RepID=A0A7J0C3F6_9ACTN|nr:hypothetical protein Sfulv_10870 [Streptomyces fulvorobeus]